MWFKKLTGFVEQTPAQVRSNLSLVGEILISHVNGKRMQCGRLEIPTLAELREQVQALGEPTGKIMLNEVVGDVQLLHRNEANAGALFQVASQFNLLEMISPNVTPEDGIDIYERDRTQGPACAIAAGAGTIYRHYFVEVEGQIGQSSAKQINTLADLLRVLIPNQSQWPMKNGYALLSSHELLTINDRLQKINEAERDQLKQLLRIGLQWNTQITLGDCLHTVSQAYCSAMPVAYSQQPSVIWQPLATLILEAAYEATLCAAILNARQTGNHQVFLTLLGGGAFGNQEDWIIKSLSHALTRYQNYDLEISIVSYGRSNQTVQQLLKHFSY